MDKEQDEQKKRFAGEKKPSMQRRCAGHDYQQRQYYMITMVTEGRVPYFGRVAGRSDGAAGSAEAPHVELTELGARVYKEWYSIPSYYPQIEMHAFVLMPDHFHGVLFVRERLPVLLGKVLNGFKAGCNKAFRELLPAAAAEQEQLRRRPDGREDRYLGLLFTRGYNDKLLLRTGQLERWEAYIADNPRRLLMKREHPDLFRVQRNVEAGGQTFSAIGNRFLLQRPLRLQVQCSRSISEAELEAQRTQLLAAARAGAVLVSPAISPGEKAIMRAAFDEGLPLVYLQENGFTDLAKPGGQRMEACMRGQLLILAPWEHHNERTTIRRDQCLTLNEMARRLCTAER